MYLVQNHLDVGHSQTQHVKKSLTVYMLLHVYAWETESSVSVKMIQNVDHDLQTEWCHDVMEKTKNE